MQFSSTRNIELRVGLREAIFQGLAPDGGLYMPVEEPDLHRVFRSAGYTSSFVDVSSSMMSALFPGEFSAADCRRICTDAFPFSPVLRKIQEKLYILELFHGPSCAFKDFGASFLATVMQEYLRKDQQRGVILTATSGDTGSAVAQAFHGKQNIDVIILYPSGRVSPSQEMQLTTMGGNVHALEVKGNFDDCQRMVKEAFLDTALRSRFPLTSANSINLGRLIPQSFYYAWAFAQLKRDREAGEVYFSVPSGNFGNLTAGILAWRWGLPVKGFIAATNANDVVPEYLLKGSYEPRPSVATLSNAMDVGSPSNFERLQSIFNMDITRMRTMILPDVVNDRDTKAVMQRYYDQQHMFICPHTAVGILAAERFREKHLDGSGSVVALATAHPGKFSEVAMEACGVNPDMPERLAEFMQRTKQSTVIEPRLDALINFLDAKIDRG
jgi:threonine synthase